jgi:hypothetical protein
MNLEMASALAHERQRDLARQASQWHMVRCARESVTDVNDTRAPRWRIPRYRVRWSRVSLPAIGAVGRRERSWVIVISATRGL